MGVVFDPAKDAANIAKHGVSLGRAEELDVKAVQEDVRRAYGETRYRAWGLLDGSAHVLAFTIVGDQLRAISLRRAHLKEYRRHVLQ